MRLLSRGSHDLNVDEDFTWWRHQMETFSALLAICAENSPVPGEYPTQRPVARSFDVYFDLRPDKLLSKQSWGWWSETLSHSLWRHRNEWWALILYMYITDMHASVVVARTVMRYFGMTFWRNTILHEVGTIKSGHVCGARKCSNLP